MQTPFRLNDIALIVVVISSMVFAIVFPDFSSRFKEFPFYCLMINFFLSYLSIDLKAVWKTLRGHSLQILALSVLKLAVLPAVIYFIFYFIAPDYAFAALLLSGVSSGVVSPMISNMVRGNSALVLIVVVITSALVPFMLPAIIKIICAKEVAISFLSMLRMLATVIFIPIIAVEVIRYLMPRFVAPIMKIQFPLALITFALINLGVFYRYAPFFKKEPSMIILATVVASSLAAIFCVVGILVSRRSTLEDQLASVVILTNVNNVLVIVFSSEFFGPVEPLVAAMYMIPFFVVVIPLRYYYYCKTGVA